MFNLLVLVVAGIWNGLLNSQQVSSVSTIASCEHKSKPLLIRGDQKASTLANSSREAL
jgi:hypothetical protein